MYHCCSVDFFQEILCSAPDNLQFQQLLVKPQSISSGRLQHPLGAPVLKQELIFVNGSSCEGRNSQETDVFKQNVCMP